MIEDLGVVVATRWVQELMEPKKATYPLMSESGADYSWDGFSDDLKEALLEFMAVNDLVESSLAGVTAQLQVFTRIGMISADAISDIARNGFLDQPTTNKDMSDKKQVCFMIFQRFFQITAIMCAVQEAPVTRQSNIDAMDRYCNAKQNMYKLVKR